MRHHMPWCLGEPIVWVPSGRRADFRTFRAALFAQWASSKLLCFLKCSIRHGGELLHCGGGLKEINSLLTLYNNYNILFGLGQEVFYLFFIMYFKFFFNLTYILWHILLP
jgi:hypothetical protein